jgi:hypothetical protein
MSFSSSVAWHLCLSFNCWVKPSTATHHVCVDGSSTSKYGHYGVLDHWYVCSLPSFIYISFYHPRQILTAFPYVFGFRTSTTGTAAGVCTQTTGPKHRYTVVNIQICRSKETSSPNTTAALALLHIPVPNRSTPDPMPQLKHAFLDPHQLMQPYTWSSNTTRLVRYTPTMSLRCRQYANRYKCHHVFTSSSRRTIHLHLPIPRWPIQPSS